MAQIKRSVRPEYLSVFAFIFLCWSPHWKGFILPQQDQQRIWYTQYLQNIQLSPLSRRGHSTETALLSVPMKPCELQKLILINRFSFCWIYLLLLTWLTIRSTCPPSHYWASQGFHFAGLNPISLSGPSRWPGEGRNPEHINWSLGFFRDQLLDPSSSPHILHH